MSRACHVMDMPWGLEIIKSFDTLDDDGSS